MAGDLPLDALVQRAEVSMNPLRNLMQVSDQRVAHVSHLLLAPGKCTLPLDEAKALMATWRDEIGGDAEKFAEKVRAESHCPTAERDGDLGYIVRAKCCPQLDDIIFKEEPGRTYGPVVDRAGLHLIYLHSCREPGSRAEAALGLPFSMSSIFKKDDKA